MQAQCPGEWTCDEERLVVAPLGQPLLGERDCHHDGRQRPGGALCEFMLHDRRERRRERRSECRLPAEFECAHDPVKWRGVGAEDQGTRKGRWSELAAFATRARVLDGALQAAADRPPDGSQTRIAPAGPVFAPREGLRAGRAGAWQEHIGGV